MTCSDYLKDLTIKINERNRFLGMVTKSYAERYFHKQVEKETIFQNIKCVISRACQVSNHWIGQMSDNAKCSKQFCTI